MRIGRRHGDRVAAEVAVGRDAGDDAGVGIDAEPFRQRGREAQRVAGGRRCEVAGDVEREALAFIAALIGDCGGSRTGVTDHEVEALADRLAMRIGRRHGDRVAAEVAVGRDAGDDAGVGIDAEPFRQRGREAQCVAGGRRCEVAGDVEREALALIAALIGDCGRARTGVADHLEALADRLSWRSG